MKAQQPGTIQTPLQKIIFKFFFVFFLLETLTELVTGNWFGATTFVWELGERIYTRPLIWLNDHFFHFVYKPAGSWTTLTGSLILIRHIMFLLFSVLGCFLWTIFDSKTKTLTRLNFWFSKGLRVVLACTIFSYGIIKIFPVQMRMPTFTDLHKTLGELTPFDLVWDTFGYGKPYQIATGIFEVLASIFILFNRTLVIGLLLLLVILANVILLNYTFVIGVLDLSALLFLVTVYLLHPYFNIFHAFFLKDRSVALPQFNYAITSKWEKYIMPVLAFLLILVSFSLNSVAAYKRYSAAEAVNKTRKYSEVKTFIINSDTLKPFTTDTTCWRSWSERIVNKKLLVTVATMDIRSPKSYALSRDTVNHLLTLLPVSAKDTAVLTFLYKDIDKTNWHLEGNIKERRISVDLHRIDPDTVFNLLKTKRTFLGRDNDSE